MVLKVSVTTEKIKIFIRMIKMKSFCESIIKMKIKTIRNSISCGVLIK